VERTYFPLLRLRPLRLLLKTALRRLRSVLLALGSVVELPTLLLTLPLPLQSTLSVTLKHLPTTSLQRTPSATMLLLMLHMQLFPTRPLKHLLCTRQHQVLTLPLVLLPFQLQHQSQLQHQFQFQLQSQLQFQSQLQLLRSTLSQ
jgi:hypothetical protein